MSINENTSHKKLLFFIDKELDLVKMNDDILKEEKYKDNFDRLK